MSEAKGMGFDLSSFWRWSVSTAMRVSINVGTPKLMVYLCLFHGKSNSNGCFRDSLIQEASRFMIDL